MYNSTKEHLNIIKHIKFEMFVKKLLCLLAFNIKLYLICKSNVGKTSYFHHDKV